MSHPEITEPNRIELPGGHWEHHHAGMGSIYLPDGSEIYHCGRNQVEKLFQAFRSSSPQQATQTAEEAAREYLRDQPLVGQSHVLAAIIQRALDAECREAVKGSLVIVNQSKQMIDAANKRLGEAIALLEEVTPHIGYLLPNAMETRSKVDAFIIAQSQPSNDNNDGEAAQATESKP